MSIAPTSSPRICSGVHPAERVTSNGVPRRQAVRWASEQVRGDGRSRRILTFLTLLAAALILRAPSFGHPELQIDEAFYLLVGDRLLDGALPFIDLWDRKPVGLFLIYAAIQMFGGDAILAYQLVATLFAAATSFVVQRIAAPAVGPLAGALAGLLYLVCLDPLGGDGGQSPVFYNLLMACAALAMRHAIDAPETAVLRRAGVVAMACVGLAIQVKYTAAIEGMAFGLLLSALCWRLQPQLGRLVQTAAGFAAIALLPTALVALGYVLAGEGEAFWFANFVSIFGRAEPAGADISLRLIGIARFVVPLAIVAAIGVALLIRARTAPTRSLLLLLACWLPAALAGFVAVGTFYDHYALPLLLPLAIAAAAALRAPVGPALVALLVSLVLQVTHWPALDRTRDARADFAALVALLPRDVDRRCLHVFDGPATLYLASNACLVTRYVFPDHLSAANEATAIGVDPAAEVRRLLARRPRAIVLGDKMVRPPNRATFAIMRAALRRDYRLAGAVPWRERNLEVHVLR